MSDTELTALRDGVRALHGQARHLHGELLELEKVDRARAAFKEVLGGEERRLEGLRQRVSALEGEKQSRLRQLERPGAEETEYEAEDEYAGGGGDVPTDELARRAAKEEPASAARLTQARKRFQKFVNMYHYFLRVSEARRAQINQIVEDPQRPLGEALVLLEWDTFENRVGPPGAESDAKYLERLKDWGESLREYVKKAEGDVRAVEIRYGAHVMLIWKAWRAAAGGASAEWDRLIKDSRAAFEHEAAKLERQIDALEVEVAALKGGPGGEVADGR